MPVKTAGNASVTIGSAIADVARARVTITNTLVDTTSIESAYTELTPANLTGTATVELFYSSAAHGTAIGEAAEAGTEQTVTIAFESGKSVSGKALIESVDWDMAPNGVSMATVNFRFCNGTITVIG